HAVDLGRIHHAADVLAQAENRGAGWRGVAADPFKHRRSVAHHVGENVYGRFGPGNEAAVVPDFFGRRQHTVIIAEEVAGIGPGVLLAYGRNSLVVVCLPYLRLGPASRFHRASSSGSGT